MAVALVVFILNTSVWSSVGFLSDAQVVAHTMVVVKHLLVGSHIEVTFKTVKISELKLSSALDESANLN